MYYYVFSKIRLKKNKLKNCLFVKELLFDSNNNFLSNMIGSKQDVFLRKVLVVNVYDFKTQRKENRKTFIVIEIN